MIDLNTISNFAVTGNPRFQRAVARTLLLPNYRLAGVKIEASGAHWIPKKPVFFAMNHTDRYNYWPFQLYLWRQQKRFTAAWVKAKYFEHPLMMRFFSHVNAIPTISKGYVIFKDHIALFGRKPSDEVYLRLRDYVDGKSAELEMSGLSDNERSDADILLDRPRSMLGRRFDPRSENYCEAVNATFAAHMKHLVHLTRRSQELGLDVLVFPQGTRSIRLSKGRTGLMQLAFADGMTVLPVGCNGSDKVYPASTPLARKGRIEYRIGKPIEIEKISGYRAFDPESERSHKEALRTTTNQVMGAINDLLDPEYQYTADKESEGVQGAARFL